MEEFTAWLSFTERKDRKRSSEKDDLYWETSPVKKYWATPSKAFFVMATKMKSFNQTREGNLTTAGEYCNS